jgi:hypothetical protein
MDGSATARQEGIPARPILYRTFLCLVLLGLLAWQGWLTLALFGPGDPWQNLTNEEPITSGRHCLHLYHGYLGASIFRERGMVSGYDPAFQAGYPKTPVFDSGSRPAELFSFLVNGRFQPSAYKIGFAVCCVAAPLVLYVAAWASGLGGATSVLATVLGLMVWWGLPGRELLEKGDLDVILAGLAALLHVGFLIRFHQFPGPLAWLGLVFTGWLGWFADAMIFVPVVPLVLIYYLSVGCKHRLLWHAALFVALCGGVALNIFWLLDWVTFLWVRAPLQPDAPLLAHLTFHTVWSAPVWGANADRWLASAMFGLGVLGIWILNETHQRPAARVLGFGAGMLLALALAGTCLEPLSALGTPRLWVPGLCFLALPAAHACVRFVRYSSSWLGHGWRPVALWGTAAVLLGYFGRRPIEAFALHYAHVDPLKTGLSPEERDLVDIIKQNTTPQARILWEDSPENDGVNCWTPLLPLLTERAFLGGLDASASIDHMFATLTSRKLAERSFAAWSDAQLKDFCERYNIGWIVCRSQSTVARFEAWKKAALVRTLSGDRARALFRVPVNSFALKGKARLVEANFRHVALADVEPDDGRVVLSMHYHPGLRVTPSRVQIEKEPDPYDPIPFLRLRLTGPVARLTLTWQGR